jgi:hypothetical protein
MVDGQNIPSKTVTETALWYRLYGGRHCHEEGSLSLWPNQGVSSRWAWQQQLWNVLEWCTKLLQVNVVCWLIELHSGRPWTSIVLHVWRAWYKRTDQWWLNMSKIAVSISVVIDRVHHISHNVLWYCKVSARWVPGHLMQSRKCCEWECVSYTCTASQGKVMLIVFWETQNIFLLESLVRGKYWM